MCGICGQLNFARNHSVDSRLIEAMTKIMSHRGPDDDGFYISGPVGLGFRRLSIIDVRGGHQPMSNRERTVWVVFNGEIYNFQQLRTNLEARGFRFQTKSDTETIIHGYKQFGTSVLSKLNGMFGLAIWDESRKKLVLARDRIGIKPLYYAVNRGKLYFASEIRPLLLAIGGSAEIDPTAISLFLRYRYIPSPFTPFKEIKKLAPGTSLVVENGQINVERWWNHIITPFDPMPNEVQAEEKLLELYTAAAKRQLISDVPLGLLLSGGLDSGLLLGLMHDRVDSRQTFTVGFSKQFQNNELSAAAHTAKIFNSENISIRLHQKEFDDALPKVVSAIEEPVTASSVVPMYFLCQIARENVKVAWMGQGPDELFGGYKRHIGLHYGHLWRSVPTWMRNTIGSTLAAATRTESIKRALNSLDISNRMRRYQQVFSVISAEEISKLYQDGILPPNVGDIILSCWQDLEPTIKNVDELGGFQALEIRSSLPDELLLYADKLSMAHGLEIRVPFLDHEIVEYVERLSASYKVRNGKGKWLHRRICQRFLPKQIIRRRKIGFATPVQEWFQLSLKGRIRDNLIDESSLIYRFLRHSRVQQLIQDHQIGRHDNHKVLFSLVLVEELLRSYSQSPKRSMEPA